MNIENLAYLATTLKYAGFGEHLKSELEKGMKEGKPEFQLHYAVGINKDRMEATLNFRQSESTGRYFFNSWEGVLKNDIGKTQQTFYMNKGQGFTLKEGYNLLDGRAVHKELRDKEGKPYQAWLQLNKKEQDTNGNYKVVQFHQNYGYNLEAALALHPIRELLEPTQKEALIKSLERGNLQSVTFEKNGFTERLFIEANPQYKTISAYDHNGSRLTMQDLAQKFDFVHQEGKKDDVVLLGKAGAVRAEQSVAEKAPPEKQKLNAEGGNEGKKTEKSKASKKAGDLLPKKRERGQKNLGIA